MITRNELIAFCKQHPDHRIGYTPGKGNGAYVHSPAARASHKIHGNLYNSLLRNRELTTVTRTVGSMEIKQTKLKAAILNAEGVNRG